MRVLPHIAERPLGREAEIRRGWMVPVALALLAVLFFSPALFFGEMPIYRDFINTFLPYKLYSAQAFAAGRIPVWAPEPSFGAPFLANYQSGVLYPPSAIVYLRPNAVGVGLYLAFHFWVAAAGMSLLLARRGLSPEARLLGGIVYMLGGVFITIAEWSHLAVAAWIPLAVVAVEDLMGDPRPRRFLVLVGLLGLQVFGGAPESFAQSSALVVAAALLARGKLPWWRRLVITGMAGVLALGLGAVQLVPTVEYFGQTTRSGGLALDQALKDSLDPKTLLTFLVPHRLDGGVVAPISENQVPLFWSIYIGLAPLILAGVAIPSRRGRAWALFLGVALLLALGEHAPLFPTLYITFPAFFGAFRYPQKFLLAAHVALSVLAAIGLAQVQRFASRRPGLSPRLLGAGFCLVAAADLADVHFPAMLYSDWASLVRSAPPAGIAGQGTEARIFHYSRIGRGLEPWYPKFGPGTDMQRLERSAWAELSANVSLVYGLGFVNGADSFLVHSMLELYRKLGNLPVDRGLHVLRAFGARFLMGPERLESSLLEPLRRGNALGLWIYRLRDPAPRVYLARRARPAADIAAALAAVADPTFVPGEDAVVEGYDARELPPGALHEVTIGPEAVSVEVESQGEGLLVSNDSFFPGWKAEIDGAPVAILRANGLVRAIPVPAGRHRVTLRYRSGSFRLGLVISLSSLAAAMLAARRVGKIPLRRP